MKKGFTVLEMILVLTVIAVIVLVTVPNITQKKEIIDNVGCEALVEVVNAQILLFDLNEGEVPSSINELVSLGYITDSQTTCPDGSNIEIVDGEAFSY